MKLVPVLATFKVCDGGLGPPSGMLKLMGLAGLNTLAPTTTLTGMLTVPPAAWNTTWPMKVPAISPVPGSACAITPTVTFAGAVPFGADTLSQLPPSDVLVETVQFKVPDPPLRIWTVWLGGLLVLGVKEKLMCP